MCVETGGQSTLDLSVGGLLHWPRLAGLLLKHLSMNWWGTKATFCTLLSDGDSHLLLHILFATNNDTLLKSL